jgi:protein-tyrosine-phosphatase
LDERELLHGRIVSIDIDTSAMPSILFVCVHNAGRSQMAAGLVALHSGGAVRVHSAGSEPAREINPLAAQVMAELGVDLSDAYPKALSDDAVRQADVVVTMGCGDTCPVFPGRRYEDWQIADPADARSLEEVRAIRDDIDRRVRRLLGELGVDTIT